MLILTPLVNALQSLNKVLKARNDEPDNEFLLDAVIQRFEYSYELSHKMLRRYLSMSEASNVDLKEMSFPDLIRTASEKGLLQNGWDHWRNYRSARNSTSHAYDEKKALEVYAIIPPFYDEAMFLLAQLQQRINAK